MPAALLWAYSAEKLFLIEQCRSVCGRSGIAFSREEAPPAGDSAKQKIPEAEASGNLLEVTTRFELVDEGFADPCLTTWPRHHIRE